MTGEIEDIAERAATKAVKNLLLQLGIDAENPIEAQRDFLMLREVTKVVCDPEVRRDLDHLRLWRTRTEQIKANGTFTVFGLLISGFLAATWIGIQRLLGQQ
jgi:hypothetical protein